MSPRPEIPHVRLCLAVVGRQEGRELRVVPLVCDSAGEVDLGIFGGEGGVRGAGCCEVLAVVSAAGGAVIRLICGKDGKRGGKGGTNRSWANIQPSATVFA